MKKSDFEMACRAHDRVGFFSLFHVSHVNTELTNICDLDNFLKPVYF